MKRALVPRFRCLMFGLILASAKGATTDPVGYVTMNLVAGEKGALAVPLADGYRVLAAVTASGAGYIEFAENVPLDLMGVANSACIDVRDGPGAGQSLHVTGFSGKRVTYQHPAQFPIAPGTTVGIRPDRVLGEILGSPPQSAILQGETHESADVLGLLDPQTQQTREFFYKPGAGWLQVGSEASGDRSATAIPFRASLQFFRRGTTDLQIVLLGSVPMYGAPQHWVRVWPGRNLLTTPFTAAATLDELLVASSLVSGPSAPRSDTFRLIGSNAAVSQVFYHHDSRGWTSVGGGAVVAGETPVELSQAMDFRRVGQEGFLLFNAIDTAGQRAARGIAAPAEEEVPVDVQLSDFPARKIGWRSEPGTRYQVQVRPSGSSLWSDLGAEVVADGSVCQTTCQPEGRGIFRVIVR